VSDRLLTAAEVAEILAVPVSWVRESTRSGAMPHVQLGRHGRYRRDDVEDSIYCRTSFARRLRKARAFRTAYPRQSLLK
jgi:excisionase family DNA binding protein